MSTAKRLPISCLVVLGLLVTGGCGTRRSQEDIRSGAGLSPTGETASAAFGGNDANAAAAPAGEGGAGTVPAESTPRAGSPAAGSEAPSATVTTAQAGTKGAAGQAGAIAPGIPGRSTAAASPAPKTGSGAGSGSASSPNPGATPSNPGSPPPGAAGAAKAPVIIGNVGTYSGPVGSSLKNLSEGVQIWAKSVNERGGLNGHPVQLTVADDGGDQSKHRSLVQQLVETQKVVAFVGQAGVFTGASSVDYLTSHKIPVIGNDQGSDWFYDSPVFFTQAPTGKTYWSSVAASTGQWAQANHKAKWASVACTEATTCADGDRIWHDEGAAKKAGLDPVYRGRVSLAQPDFTAECLNAQKAGAEIFTLLVDAATTQRIAASCARQGYRPVFGTVGTSIKTEYATDPNMGDNAIATVGQFVWTDASTPAAAEFQSVMRKYLGGRAPGNGHALAWVSGKMLEKAAETLQTPNSQGILDGLWTFKNETLGGLSMPLTFVRDQNTPRQICWGTNQTQKGKWVAFNGGTITCL